MAISPLEIRLCTPKPPSYRVECSYHLDILKFLQRLHTRALYEPVRGLVSSPDASLRPLEPKWKEHFPWPRFRHCQKHIVSFSQSSPIRSLLVSFSSRNWTLLDILHRQSLLCTSISRLVTQVHQHCHYNLFPYSTPAFWQAKHAATLFVQAARPHHLCSSRPLHHLRPWQHS